MASSQYDSSIHHRRFIRLKRYDYAQAGGYYVSIVMHGQECSFGEIQNIVVAFTPPSDSHLLLYVYQ
jgi:hypothetical protein